MDIKIPFNKNQGTSNIQILAIIAVIMITFLLNKISLKKL